MADLAELHARFNQLESQLGVLFRAIKLIAKDHSAMTKLTDDLSALADEITTDIDTVAGYSGDSDTQLVSLKAKFEAGRDKLKQVIADHEKAHAVDPAASSAPAAAASPATAAPTSTDVPATAPVIPAAPAVDLTPVGGARMILADGTQG